MSRAVAHGVCSVERPSVYDLETAKRELIDLCLSSVSSWGRDEPRSELELLHLLCLASDDSVNAQVQLVRCGLPFSVPGPRDKMALFCHLGRSDPGAAEYARVVYRMLSSMKGGAPSALAAMERASERSSSLWADLRRLRVEVSELNRAVQRDLSRYVPEGCSLDEHQLEAVSFSRGCARRMLLADDMGLGKTISALGIVMDIGYASFPLLITCPSSVIGSWEAECKKWLLAFDPEIVVVDRAFSDERRNFSVTPMMKERFTEEWIERAMVRHEARETRRLAMVESEIERVCHSRRPVVLISSWDQANLRQRSLFNMRPRTIIGDESHYIKTLEAQRTRAMLRLRIQADNRLLLSGTPDPNGRSKEYYPQLRFIDEGLITADYSDYKQSYCDPKPIRIKGGRRVWSYEGRSNELSMARVLAGCRLRRKKDSLDIGLPDKTRYAIPVELTESDILYIGSVKDEIKARFQARALEIEKQLLEDGVGDDEIQERVARVLGAEAVTMAGALRVAVGRIKARHAKPLLEQMKEEGHIPVIFCAHEVVREEMFQIATEVFGKGVLTGSGATPAKERTRMVKHFQAGKVPAMVVTRAFREGITLTRSARLISVERFWIPAEEAQMEDRVHRRGQLHGVGIYYLMAPGTVDDVVDRIITWKEESVARQEGSFQTRLVQWLRAA